MSSSSTPPGGRIALLVIDVQRGFDDLAHWGGARNHPQAEGNIARLLAAFRSNGQLIVHVRHASTSPHSPLRTEHAGHQPKPEAIELPGEPVIVKNVHSAFIGTDLHERLRALDVSQVVLCGVQSDHCCSTTARMAANLGYETIFVDDATWTYDRRHPDGTHFSAELIHRVHVASLAGEFADVVATADLVARISASERAAA